MASSSGLSRARIYPSPWINLSKIIEQLDPRLKLILWYLGPFKYSSHCFLEIFRRGNWNGPVTSKLRTFLSDLRQAMVVEA